MSIAISSYPTEELLSRKLTVNLEHSEFNVRPVIKAAIPEASQTLTESLDNDRLLAWCAGRSRNYDAFLANMFKSCINNITLRSRDFALQVNGFKGVLVWSNRIQTVWPRTLGLMRLARLLGWQGAMRAAMKLLPAVDRMRRRVMSDFPCWAVISFIGVLPSEQNKGLGTSLMRNLLDRADAASHAVYVEVSEPDAVRFFERFGFQVQSKITIVSTEDLYVISMTREPPTTNDPRPLRLRPGRQSTSL